MRPCVPDSAAGHAVVEDSGCHADAHRPVSGAEMDEGRPRAGPVRRRGPHVAYRLVKGRRSVRGVGAAVYQESCVHLLRQVARCSVVDRPEGADDMPEAACGGRLRQG